MVGVVWRDRFRSRPSCVCVSLCCLAPLCWNLAVVGALGQPVGSATLGVAGIRLWFSEHALVTHLLARVPPSTDSHLLSTCN